MKQTLLTLTLITPLLAACGGDSGRNSTETEQPTLGLDPCFGVFIADL